MFPFCFFSVSYKVGNGEYLVFCFVLFSSAKAVFALHCIALRCNFPVRCLLSLTTQINYVLHQISFRLHAPRFVCINSCCLFAAFPSIVSNEVQEAREKRLHGIFRLKKKSTKNACCSHIISMLIVWLHCWIGENEIALNFVCVR